MAQSDHNAITQHNHTNTVARTSKVPIYHQLYEILRDHILSGDWKVGDLVPPEPELMETFDVSRITVRKAVELLANENLVYKRRGKGTFVSMATLKTDASRLIGFEADMRQRGFDPETVVLESDVVTVSRVTAEKMQIEVGDELAFIKRLRLANNEPISIEEVYIVHKYCEGILDGHDYTDESLFDVMENDYGVRIERAEQTISAMVATDRLQGYLDMSANEALIFIERISYSQIDIPVEFRRIYYRADRYALQLALKR
jgi:GntR family transcriptional regulator